MRRADRLFDLIARLGDGKRHRAEDLARDLAVSVRTIYRDMDTLRASGVAISGTPGAGYRGDPQLSIPPLSVTADQLEVLHLGLAIVAQSPDPGLAAAATSLADKIDAALPETAAPPDLPLTLYPFSDAARGFSHMPILRAAIRGRQKLRLGLRGPDGSVQTHDVRPLQLRHWGRIWTLLAWSETLNDFARLRIDLMESAATLPELFVDEPGKRLADYAP
ncbi:MAG: helix-turn-helix transcriptional regulator [Marinibacterium sp.]